MIIHLFLLIHFQFTTNILVLQIKTYLFLQKGFLLLIDITSFYYNKVLQNQHRHVYGGKTHQPIIPQPL